MGKWKHVYSPTKGICTSLAPTLLPPEASPYMKGVYLKNGVISSDFGYKDFPSTGSTATNQLNGSVMRIDQFYLLNGNSYLICMTTTNLYWYDGTTWQVMTQGTEIDDCEAAWDAQANVTSTADATIHLRDSKSAKHVIATGFTTGIVSSEDNLQNVDISAAANTHLSFWVRASATVAKEVLSLRLSEQAAGATGATYADYFIPALVTNEWQNVVVAIASPDADDGGGTYPDDLNVLASVALVANSDPGVVTIYLDDIRTVKKFTGDEDNRFSVATMNDTFIITNGVDQPQKLTETGGALNTAVDLTTALSTGSITTAESVFSFKDHLFLINNTENAAACPQRVTWTNIGTIEDFTGGTSGYQDLMDDESWVVSAEILAENEYIIYKERAIVKMVWVGGHTPFRFRTMVTGAGLIGADAITNIGGEHLVFGPDVIYGYTGDTEISVLDDLVRDALYDVLDKTYQGRSLLLYVEEDGELQIWIPTGTAYPDDIWCYDVNKKIWYRKDRTMTGFGYYSAQASFTIGDLEGTIGEQNWRFGDALIKSNAPITLVGDHNGKVYQLDKTTLNNDGSAITNEFQTPDFVLPDSPEYMNMFMRTSQLIFEAYGQSVDTSYSTDGGASWGKSVTHTLTGSWEVYQHDFDVTPRKIRFKFKNETASSGFNIRYYGFYWMPRSGRR